MSESDLSLQQIFIPLQEATAYQDSLLWSLHRQAYQQGGTQILLEDVPYNISSNPCLAAQLVEDSSVNLAEQMFHCVDQDRERLRQFLPWVDQTQTVADEEKYLALKEEEWQAQKHFDYGLYCQTEEQSRLYMGNIGVFNLAWEHARCEIGYWILGSYEGQGYMTEAVALLEKELFAQGLHRIEIRCSALNRRSAGVPRRLNYHLEGCFKDYLWEQGEYRNLEIYAKLNPAHAPQST